MEKEHGGWPCLKGCNKVYTGQDGKRRRDICACQRENILTKDDEKHDAIIRTPSIVFENMFSGVTFSHE